MRERSISSFDDDAKRVSCWSFRKSSGTCSFSGDFMSSTRYETPFSQLSDGWSFRILLPPGFGLRVRVRSGD